MPNIVYCKLTGKKLIIQKYIYAQNDNPQFMNQDKTIERYQCRYLSHKHDEFKICEVYPHEVSNKPIPKDE